jgi:Ino eighty subunit 2
METINKLLKKQAPKTTRKNALMGGGDETPDSDGQRADPMFVRWVSTKTGNRVGVPDDLLTGPAGEVFKPGGQGLRGKMVEEVS